MRKINTPFGVFYLKNETTDNQGYPWCDLYFGENQDKYVGTCACSMQDNDDIILAQIEELMDSRLDLLSIFEVETQYKSGRTKIESIIAINEEAMWKIYDAKHKNKSRIKGSTIIDVNIP